MVIQPPKYLFVKSSSIAKNEKYKPRQNQQMLWKKNRLKIIFVALTTFTDTVTVHWLQRIIKSRIFGKMLPYANRPYSH